MGCSWFCLPLCPHSPHAHCFSFVLILNFFLCAYVWWPTRILVSGASFSLRFPSSHHSFSANTTWLTESVIIDMLMLYTFFICLLLLVLQYGCVRLTLGVGQSLVLRHDSSSYLFLFTLLFISVGVLTWSYYYMDSEVMYRRFASLIFLFLCSIFLLVFSADLLSLFVAWDLLGFTSFFLVIFFRSRASRGGVLTSLANRIGDVLLLSVFGMVCYGSSTPFSWSLYILFFVGFTKSAQVPFSRWLPAAMLAPTPVSALVHSSTLVTAGVYLLYRFLPVDSVFLVGVGCLTILLAGISACFEFDFKKIIALSTLRQLGLIVSSLGLGFRCFCFAHLNVHAAFKALLFLVVGTVIHSHYGSQEVRASVPLLVISPFLSWILVVGCSSMCGLPFLSGWVTKEAMLESCLNSGGSLFTLVIYYLGIGLTLLYCVRLCQLLFKASSVVSYTNLRVVYPRTVADPLKCIAVQSILSGWFFFDLSCSSFPTVLSWADKLLVWCILLSLLFVFYHFSESAFLSLPPISILSYPTYFLSSKAVAACNLTWLEDSSLQGLGLAKISSVFAPSRLGVCLCRPQLVLLFFLFLSY